MRIACTKLEMCDPKGTSPTLQSTKGLIMIMESIIAPRRIEISWDFWKECLLQSHVAPGDASTSQMKVGGDKYLRNHPTNSNTKRLKGKIPQPPAQILDTIFNKFGHKIKLSALL